MEIRYSQHFLLRQVPRSIPAGLAEEIFHHAESYLRDSLTDTPVGVRRALFFGTEQDIALVYRRMDEQVVVFIIIHPLREGEIERRILNGRWVPYDPESAL